MKTYARKLIALLLAVCLLAGALPVAMAHNLPEVAPVELEVTAEKVDGGIELLYQAISWINADITDIIFAKIDRIAKLEKLRFTCTLTDEVTAALPEDQELPDFYFISCEIDPSEKIDMFIPAADPKVENGSIVLTYKLNPVVVEDKFQTMDAATLRYEIMRPMVMSLHTDFRPIAPETALEAVESLHTRATITMSNNDGTNVPIFMTPTALLAEGELETPLDPPTRSVNVSLKKDYDPFMEGYPDDTFKPDGAITRAEVSQVLSRRLDAPARKGAAAGKFTDVAPDAWYADAVNELAGLGYLKGSPDGSFRPNAPITRAEMAALLVRFAEPEGEIEYTADFVDVPAYHWAYDAIRKAAAFGWIKGVGDNRFSPDRPITRAEAAKLICVMLDRHADKAAIAIGAGRSFTDVNDSHWAYLYIEDATTKRQSVKVGSFEIWTSVA